MFVYIFSCSGFHIPDADSGGYRVGAGAVQAQGRISHAGEYTSIRKSK